MKNPKNVTKNINGSVHNETVVSSVDRRNNWTGSVTRRTGNIRVTVNSLSGLFSRSEQFIVRKKA